MKLDVRNGLELKELPAGIPPPSAIPTVFASRSLEALPAGIPPRIIRLTSALAILARIDRDISSSVLLNRPLSEGFGQLTSLKKLYVPSHMEDDRFPTELRGVLEAQGCSIK